PQPRAGIVGMTLPLVLFENRLAQRLFLLGAEDLAGALSLLMLDLHQHAGCLFAAHNRNTCIRPHPQKARIIGAATHAVVAGPETPPNDHRELGNLSTGYGGHQFSAVLGDTARLVFLADHEAGDVLQE